MAADLALDKFWVNKSLYHDAEKKYYENLPKLQKNWQSCVEALEDKCEEAKSKKVKEITKLQTKNHKIMSHPIDVDALKKELKSLEAKNARNESFKSRSDSGKRCYIEIIKRNEEYDCDMNKSFINFEKKLNEKEVNEEKIKIEKKAKKMKGREEVLDGVGMSKLNQDKFPKTSLAGEVAKARQHIKSSLECMDQSMNDMGNISGTRFNEAFEKMKAAIDNLTKRLEVLESKCACCPYSQPAVCPAKPSSQAPPPAKPTKGADEDDVDLFGSESEEEDEEAKKIREQRLAEYAAKKSKKPALVAKSNIILDIKPWDDETNMQEMEKAVRAIEMDGLVWGASKLMPVAFKIFKLQISCVIEDDKVSVDALTETLEGIEDYIQSVDIAAFNKV